MVAQWEEWSQRVGVRPWTDVNPANSKGKKNKKSVD
jgi:hypothetical protein